MGEASLDRAQRTPGSPRSVPPGPLAAAFGILFMLAWLIFVTMGGPGGAAARLSAIPWWGSDSWLEAAVRAAILGYTLVLPALGERRAAECRTELARAGLSTPRDAIPRLARRRAALVASTAAGVLLTSVIGLVPARGPGGLDVVAAIWFAVFGGLIGRALGAHFILARHLSRLGAGIEIDLLDLEPLTPLVRWGLRIVWLWVMWFALISLFWVAPGPPNWINALGLVPLVAIALAALVMPVSGVHRRVVSAKQHELARLRDAIRSELASTRDGRDAGSPRLANLIAWRGVVEAVREWPFDVPALSRFVFYVLLGAGSWIGAALVERLVGLLLGGS